MENTVNLQLPYLMPAQAQKHVTHNEALAMLDAIVQLSVLDRHLSTPPEGADEGARYIVADAATGDWSGWGGSIALRMDGGWRRFDARPGWLAWLEDEDTYVRWTGSAWTEAIGGSETLQNLSRLGVGTEADEGNPFAAKLNSALWTARYGAEGGDGDLRYVLNKETAGNTLSVLMQSNWSGRAEMGLVGTEDFVVKVSADGTTWKEAMRLDKTSGAVRFPNNDGLQAVARLSGKNGAFVRYTGDAAAEMQAIVGTVSQSAGIPTGAIIEAGSNANGNYVRWADGTQIATKTISASGGTTNALGSFFTTTGISAGAYPAAFAATPNITASGLTDAGNCWILTTIEPNASSFGVWRIASYQTAGSSYTLRLTAIGRWF